MKICYIANSESSHTAKWVNYFVSQGNEVHVISHSNVNIPGAHVHYVHYNLKNFLFKFNKVKKIVSEIKPDILHAHQANTCGLYGTCIKGYKVIVSAWGSDILEAPEKSVIMKYIVKHVVRNAYFMTSDSYNMTDKIVEFGGNRDNIFTFPMGIEEELTQYEHVYDVKNNSLNIISTRRLEKMYNIDIIIGGFAKALSKVRDTDINLNLTVAADGNEMDKLKSLAANYNIEDKIKFTGRYKMEQLGQMLSDSDVFISIPQSDSTSVSLLESMGCGLFSIVCDLPANREWIEHENNGYILPQIDENSVCEAILWCANNKKHMADVSSQNRKIIKEKAVWNNNVKIVENLYNRIIALKSKERIK